MPKNAVQLLQEIEDKMGDQLSRLSTLTDSQIVATDILTTSAQSLLALVNAIKAQEFVALTGVDGGAPANIVALHEFGNVVRSDVRTFSGTSFNHPADGNIYAVADAVSNSTTAALVTASVFLLPKPRFHIVGGGFKKTSTTVTAASFRMHLYAQDPAIGSGVIGADNAAFSTKIGVYLGAVDFTTDQAFSDGTFGRGIPRVGNSIPVNLPLAAIDNGYKMYAFFEARDTYTPTSGETFTPFVELVF